MVVDRLRFSHRNETGQRVRRRLSEARPQILEAREAGFEQDLVRDRRRPGGLRHVVREIVIARPRFGRGGERPETDPVVPASSTAAATGRDRRPRATVLILVGEGDAVPRAHLSGQLELEDVAPVRTAPFDRRVLRVGPGGRVAGVAVGEEPLDERRAPEVAHAAEEPQPVAKDRAAKRTADVVLVEQRGRPRQADAAQIVVDVVRPQAVAGAAVERGSVERVAARSWNEVDTRPAGFGLTQPARHQHLHLVGVGHVVDERGDAAAVERRRHRHAVDQHASFVGAARRWR